MTPSVRTLLHYRFRQTRHKVRQAWTEGKSQLFLVTGFLLLFYFGATVLFRLMFRYLSDLAMTQEARDVVLAGMLPMLFFCLFVMLMFSSGIMSWVAFFRAEEIDGMMSWPLHPKELFLVKFIESFVFSAWAFFFLIGPLFSGYGSVIDVGALFLPLTFLAAAAFALCTAALGTLVSVVVARWFSKWKRVMIWGGSLSLIAFGITVWLEMKSLQYSEYAVYSWAQTFRARFEFVETSFLPPYWMNEAFRAAAGSDAPRALFVIGLLGANALFLLHLAGNVLAPAWLTCKNNMVRTRKVRKAGLLSRLIGPRGGRDTQSVLLWKDIVVFLRDPAQWLQLAIFFGILAIYFINLNHNARNYASYDFVGGTINEKHIAFINLAATLLTLGTFTTRFVYPQISLEGRRFWILGQLPLSRGRVLLSKFLFSALGSLTIALSLTLLSVTKLELTVYQVGIQIVLAASVCIGLCGMACGLGILFPDFRATSATRVVSGLGGTINLVAGSLFLAVAMGLSIPAFWNAESMESMMAGHRGPMLILAVGSGLLAGWIPMRLGARRIASLDF